MAAALQIWSPTFSKAFDSLPASVRDAVQRKVDETGARLESFPHKRLQGRAEFKLRAPLITRWFSSPSNRNVPLNMKVLEDE